MRAAAGAEAVSADDERHMQRALELARRGVGHTEPNPAVGCVILDSGGAVVGEGYHPQAGAPHAEVYALRAASTAARGGTAYVTLEPCSHYGRTPPCAAALVAAGIARVVVAIQDPNPLVGGRGLARLRDNGIAVAVPCCKAEAAEVNQDFLQRMAVATQ